ncbi:unnamed protein product [Adineta ricciae]|uniref:Uncharacterized protein n=1 Tax=Adineta ricciae TaxID=249248 RepID=A0A813YQL7_ADIRI|nr:unnamed protein product [Adineta ricciae]CAF0887672.1 unnamed protein product [Adineta ricciae]
MAASFVSKKVSLSMIQVSIVLLGLLVIGNWAAPAGGELEEIYFETCQESCSVVKNEDEASECREKFCSSYTNYLLTGTTIPDSATSLATSHHKEAAEFCATWMLHLIQELGWQRRNRLNAKDCICAAGNDCFVYHNQPKYLQ